MSNRSVIIYFSQRNGLDMNTSCKKLITLIIDDLLELSVWSYDYLLSNELGLWADEMLDITEELNNKIKVNHSNAIIEDDLEELIYYYKNQEIPQRTGNYDTYQALIAKSATDQDNRYLRCVIDQSDNLCRNIMMNFHRLFSSFK